MFIAKQSWVRCKERSALPAAQPILQGGLKLSSLFEKLALPVDDVVPLSGLITFIVPEEGFAVPRVQGNRRTRAVIYLCGFSLERPELGSCGQTLHERLISVPMQGI